VRRDGHVPGTRFRFGRADDIGPVDVGDCSANPDPFVGQVDILAPQLSHLAKTQGAPRREQYDGKVLLRHGLGDGLQFAGPALSRLAVSDQSRCWAQAAAGSVCLGTFDGVLMAIPTINQRPR
jgi:hypothetical protein